MLKWWLEQGDCANLLKPIPDASVDALVTDPPAGISFMGKEWDSARGGRDKWIAWLVSILSECRRALKPGAYGWVWALPRTSHWTATACEDAGFVVRDVMTHVFGCLTDDAEILTSTGWKQYLKVEIGDLVLGLAPNGTFIWQPVQQVHVYDHDQIAFRIHSGHTDHIVTAGHRMLVGGIDNDWVVGVADEIALQRQAIVPVLEDLPALLAAFPVPQQIAGNTKQVLQQKVFCPGTSTEGQETSSNMPAMSQDLSAKEQYCAQQGEVLQLQLSGSLLPANDGHVSDGGKGQGGLDGRQFSLVSAQDERRQESDVEGWGDAVQEARSVQWGEVRSVPCRAIADGSKRWIRDGAPADRRPADRQSASAIGGGPSCEPQSTEQLGGKPDAFQVESGSQTFRGSRFTVADLATIEPVHYRGKVWCVKVPTGVFAARRKGQAFLTGNTGFPKSRSLLKPASEHWILIKAPGELQELRIDENRIEAKDSQLAEKYASVRNAPPRDNNVYGKDQRPRNKGPLEPHPAGRWPANFALSHSDECEIVGTRKVKTSDPRRADGSVMRVPDADVKIDKPRYCDEDGNETVEAWQCVDGCPVKILDEQSGVSRSGVERQPRGTDGDKGGASRFFYCAKPSTKERSAGLLEGARNTHTTVKSIALMRHLINLIATPDALVLDPFAGSGSTGVAALQNGCRFVGVEREDEYVEIARQRLSCVDRKTSQ